MKTRLVGRASLNEHYVILLFRLELDVGIEDFRVFIHGCTTVVAGRHWLVIYHAVCGRLF
jgi:hypothetical protein